MRITDGSSFDIGGGVQVVAQSDSPDDYLAFGVEGEPYPRLIIKPDDDGGVGGIRVGNGQVFPTTALGSGSSSGALKEPLSGAIDRWAGVHIGADNTYTAGDLRTGANGQFLDGAQARDLVTGCIINADWCTLEPSKPNNWDFAAFETELDTIEANGQSVTGIGVRLFAGRFMPAWILNANSKELSISHFYPDQATPANEHFGTSAQSTDTNWGGGAAFSGTDFFSTPDSGTNGAMPKWWHPRLADHYFRLMSEFARRYGSDDRIRQIQMTMVSTYYGEPMLHQRTAESSTSANKLNFMRIGDTPTKSEGWTEELEMANWDRMFEIHDACFGTTRSTLACNPAERYVDDTGNTAYTASIDPDFSGELMRRAKAILGDKLILTNHSIRNPWQTSANNCWYHTAVDRYSDMFNQMYENSERIGWQTAPMSTLSNSAANLKAALAGGVTRGGGYAELPSGYTDYLTSTEWQTYQDDYIATAAAVSAP